MGTLMGAVAAMPRPRPGKWQGAMLVMVMSLDKHQAVKAVCASMAQRRVVPSLMRQRHDGMRHF